MTAQQFLYQAVASICGLTLAVLSIILNFIDGSSVGAALGFVCLGLGYYCNAFHPTKDNWYLQFCGFVAVASCVALIASVLILVI